MTADRSSSADAWTRYWRAGHAESFAPISGFDASAIWSDFFACFDDGARLLDLATGGGSVVRSAIATGARLNRSYHILGVDLADIAGVEPGPQGSCTVQSRGQVDLKSLPFEDGFFDGATSQFGVEYADSAAGGEAVRVLKKGGRGLFLLHHAAGAVVQSAIARLDSHRRVFPDDTVFRCGARMYEQLARGGPHGLASESVAKFQEAVAAAVQRLAAEGSPSNTREVVSFLADVSAAPMRYDPRSALRQLQFVEEDAARWLVRQLALADAALDERGVSDLSGLLREAGAEVEALEPVKAATGEIVAWSLAFRRRL